MTPPKTVIEILETMGQQYMQDTGESLKIGELNYIDDAAQAIHQYYMSRIPVKYDGWSNFGKRDLTEIEEAYNEAIDQTIAAFEREIQMKYKIWSRL